MTEEIEILKNISKNVFEKLNNNIKYFEDGKCTVHDLENILSSCIEINLGRFQDAIGRMIEKEGGDYVHILSKNFDNTKELNNSHVTIRNNKLFCLNCGSEHSIPFPIAVKQLSDMSDRFEKLHANCKKVWKQPEVDQSLPPSAKADWWLENGEHGKSSKTMFQFLSGRDIGLNKEYCSPHEPDDFRRCYLLIKTVPEWRPLLNRLSPVSPVWKKIVDNWDRLSQMLEEMMNTQKENGMYDLMKSLGC